MSLCLTLKLQTIYILKQFLQIIKAIALAFKVQAYNIVFVPIRQERQNISVCVLSTFQSVLSVAAYHVFPPHAVMQSNTMQACMARCV